MSLETPLQVGAFLMESFITISPNFTYTGNKTLFENKQIPFPISIGSFGSSHLSRIYPDLHVQTPSILQGQGSTLVQVALSDFKEPSMLQRQSEHVILSLKSFPFESQNPGIQESHLSPKYPVLQSQLPLKSQPILRAESSVN